jgi:hypothetical protein
VARLLVWLGVIERAPGAPSALIRVVLVGGHFGRGALDEHDLRVTCRNFGEESTWGVCAPLYGEMPDRAGRASRQSRDSPNGSVGPLDTPTLTPQSKPVTHASRLVAQKYAPLVAFGLGPGILAAGPVTYRQYSLLRQLCDPDLNSFVGSTGTGHRVNQALRPSPEAPPQSCCQATIHR